ncbi:hypothetical protein EVAR_39924_1 [Eumeta japonica]|uniref:Uncharacterized protein n=1 Tax=Eumeta variegata TaxID=151549 RepID=A0A4C1WQS2_EUMVA|nr:hypothetical protein EVAR_39924_1 [Eumeta japonica]
MNIKHDDTIIHHEYPPQLPSEVVQPPAAPVKRSSHTSKKLETSAGSPKQEKRHFAFGHENKFSSKRLIRAEVSQGSALSPLLYSSYTNEIPRSQTGVQLALFAVSAATYEAPPPHHFIRRLRNVLTDLLDDFTEEVERFIKINNMSIIVKNVKNNYQNLFISLILSGHQPVRFSRFPAFSTEGLVHTDALT